MYASLQHTSGYYEVADQRAVSQRAAERYQQVSAAEARRHRARSRKAGARRRQQYVPVA